MDKTLVRRTEKKRKKTRKRRKTGGQIEERKRE